MAILNRVRSWSAEQYIKRLDEQIAEKERDLAYLRSERRRVWHKQEAK